MKDRVMADRPLPDYPSGSRNHMHVPALGLLPTRSSFDHLAPLSLGSHMSLSRFTPRLALAIAAIAASGAGALTAHASDVNLPPANAGCGDDGLTTSDSQPSV